MELGVEHRPHGRMILGALQRLDQFSQILRAIPLTNASVSLCPIRHSRKNLGTATAVRAWARRTSPPASLGIKAAFLVAEVVLSLWLSQRRVLRLGLCVDPRGIQGRAVRIIEAGDLAKKE